MKKLYSSPSVEITNISSEDIMLVSGFRLTSEGGKLEFTDQNNEIQF